MLVFVCVFGCDGCFVISSMNIKTNLRSCVHASVCSCMLGICALNYLGAYLLSSQFV